MAHQITSEGGADLAPTAPGQTVAEGGASLAPTAPGQTVAEGGVSLGPTSPAVIAAEGGASLTPDAPADLTPDVSRTSALKVTGLATGEGPLGDFLVWPEDDEQDGETAWTNDHDPRWLRIHHEDTFWRIEYRVNGEFVGSVASDTDPASPVDVTVWNPAEGDIGGEILVTVATLAPPAQITPETIY